MTAPIPPSGVASTGESAAEAAESRELADYFAGRDPLDAQAALWAARRQDGLSAEEEAELQAWLAGDPARGSRLEQFEGLWGRLDELPSDDVAALKATVSPAPAAGVEASAATPSRVAGPDRKSVV